jgi:hypothetical protein
MLSKNTNPASGDGGARQGCCLGNDGPAINNHFEPRGQAYCLHYGNARTPLCRVIPDEAFAAMYRIEWPGGERSVMANLSRARDAAAAICERGPPARNRRLFRWESAELDTSKTCSGAGHSAAIQKSASGMGRRG